MSGCSSTGRLRQALAALSEAELCALASDWQVWARDDQLPPGPDAEHAPWRVWLVLGGRGSGKTRTGAEWVRAQALGLPPLAQAPARRIALIGETMTEARRVMIEGVSGLLAIHTADERPRFDAARMQVTWPNGSIAQVFAADSPDALRGPQFAVAWCDEAAKWRHAEATWDMLQFGLRLGDDPRVVVTTTPRPVPLLRTLLADERTVVSRSATADNAMNLAPAFVDEMARRYAGTALGRQELLGEMIEDADDSLWRRDWIEAARVKEPPALEMVVVAVDPPVTATARSDACGIVVAGRGRDRRFYVLADRSVQGREPNVWARAVIAAHRDHGAARVVVEVNQGGDLVALVLRQIDPAVVIRPVRAVRGKWQRAEPVAAMYAEGRVAHVGYWPALEDEMCGMSADGRVAGKSPDRLDALVWALSELMRPAAAEPQIRVL